MKWKISYKAFIAFLSVVLVFAIPCFAYDVASVYGVSTIVQNPLYYTMRVLDSGDTFHSLRGDLASFKRPSDFDSFQYGDLPSTSWAKFSYAGSFSSGTITVTCPISVSSSEAWVWIAVPATAEYGDVSDLYCSQARIGTGASWYVPSDVFRVDGYLITRVHLPSGSGTLRLQFSSFSSGVLPSSGSINLSFLMSDFVYIGESVPDVVPAWNDPDNIDLTGNIMDLYDEADIGGFFDNVIDSLDTLASGFVFVKNLLSLVLVLPIIGDVLPFVMCLTIIGLLLKLGRPTISTVDRSGGRSSGISASVDPVPDAPLIGRSRSVVSRR